MFMWVYVMDWLGFHVSLFDSFKNCGYMVDFRPLCRFASEPGDKEDDHRSNLR